MATYAVTGGAGYIGSHVAKQLIDAGHDVVIIDNLSTGFKKTIDILEQYAIRNQVSLTFHQVDLSDSVSMRGVFDTHQFDGMLHFAAHLIVPESVEQPLKYYLNNTMNTARLVELCIEYHVPKFIFSSTAAVYGEPPAEDVPVKETSLTRPINPYGWSKLFSEQIIQDTGRANPSFKYIILRYFNVAGADPQGLIGQSTQNATHLIKVSAEVATGKRNIVKIFGDDYPTEDGTGVRDYIHVSDLSSAHIAALAYLDTHNSDIFNCGYGVGYSVLQIVQTMKRVSGVDFTTEISTRRLGDPAILVSDNQKIKTKMNWTPQYQDVEFICKTAFGWEQNLS